MRTYIVNLHVSQSNYCSILAVMIVMESFSFSGINSEEALVNRRRTQCCRPSTRIALYPPSSAPCSFLVVLVMHCANFLEELCAQDALFTFHVSMHTPLKDSPTQTIDGMDALGLALVADIADAQVFVKHVFAIHGRDALDCRRIR